MDHMDKNQSSQTAAPSSTASGADPRRWKALILLCTALFLVILDAQIVNVALPSIVKDLDLSIEGAQWVLSGYALAFGGLLLPGSGSRCPVTSELQATLACNSSKRAVTRDKEPTAPSRGSFGGAQ
jgi:hypothetical protein